MAKGGNRVGPGGYGMGTGGILLSVLVGLLPPGPVSAATPSGGSPATEAKTTLWTPASAPRTKGPPTPAPRTSPFRALDVSVRGSIARTFDRAVGRRHGPALTQVVKRVLVWWLNVRREIHAGDRLALVYQLPPGREPLVHAVWLNAAHLKRPRTAVRYKPEGQRFARWFEPDGREVERRLVRGPIARYEQVSSLISDGRGHRGVDFKAPIGTRVRTPFSGVVVRRNWLRHRNGNCLHLRTRGGTDVYLLHLNRIARGVRPGRKVRRGQTIAWSGNTGRSSAPHLHYQLERNGRVLDPFSVHRTWRSRLPEEERKALKAEFKRFAELRANLSRT